MLTAVSTKGGGIVENAGMWVERFLLAVLRRCDPQLARRKPASERGRTGPLLAELDDDLDRTFMAEHDPMLESAKETPTSQPRQTELDPSRPLKPAKGNWRLPG
jgi:hypothetical protein